MDHGVTAAVSEAYRVFSRYSFGADVSATGGGDGIGPLEARLLRMTPPREIAPELLAVHAASLTGTIEGTAADDFRALLPRYFDLIAAERGPVGAFRRDALRGLAGAEYRRRWPAEEAEAIDRLLAALLAIAEARGATADAADIRRCMAGRREDVSDLRQGGNVSDLRPEA